MENIFKYYEFSDFFEDKSKTFLGDLICYSELNEEHFLIFEKKYLEGSDIYNLYVSKYNSKRDIGGKKPEILELLVENYDKSIPDHRIVLREYLY
ncbi:hypothetical protein SAMN04489761_1734 [Tenacibaculum sp. MAR_2009_124]|uniref:hypothetical protein n=1 Tax=Tenacibaculum sp. MAR_2009_124 TaxID=1250059 RepID=UPI0008978F10|nr:hypothetical protein [Tenacibaculum sp. MAR_2009_124]SEB77632.1 hypothetical protein SAMN04489761_1734 [Tenacibaculum sp. MAR_2009_124]